MTPDLRMSLKDYRRGKSLKVLLYKVPFGQRKYWVRMNGERWPKDARPVSVTKLFTSLRKSLVRSV